MFINLLFCCKEVRNEEVKMKYYHQSVELLVDHFIEKYFEEHPSGSIDKREVEKIVAAYLEQHTQGGKSAYEIWKDLGNEGTEQDFINSLRGSDVKIGKIEPILGGQKISFLYYDNGVQKIDAIDVMNGQDGISVVDVKVVDNVVSFKLSDGKEITAGTIVIDESKLKLENFYTKDEADEKFVSKIEIDTLVHQVLTSTMTPISEEQIRTIFNNL